MPMPTTTGGYDAVIRLDPQDPDTYAQRAIAHAFLGMEAEAREDVERAVTLGAVRASLERGLEEAWAAR